MKNESVKEKIEEVMEAAKPAKKKSSKKKVTILIESLLGGTITPEEVLSRIPKDAEKVYIKPEENKAYWVKDEETGEVDLW